VNFGEGPRQEEFADNRAQICFETRPELYLQSIWLAEIWYCFDCVGQFV
jgi:hypothetical protein